MRTTFIVVFFFLALGAAMRGPTIADTVAACMLLAVILLIFYALARAAQRAWRASAAAAGRLTGRS